MQTERRAKSSKFARVAGLPIVTEFDGGALTSDAVGLLLAAADWAVKLVNRLAQCFRDARDPRLVEHSVPNLVGQRLYSIALGYEDRHDHEELRHEPLMAPPAAELEAWRPDCAPVAGKSSLNRLELSHGRPNKYQEIAHELAALERKA